MCHKASEIKDVLSTLYTKVNSGSVTDVRTLNCKFFERKREAQDVKSKLTAL